MAAFGLREMEMIFSWTIGDFGLECWTFSATLEISLLYLILHLNFLWSSNLCRSRWESVSSAEVIFCLLIWFDSEFSKPGFVFGFVFVFPFFLLQELLLNSVQILSKCSLELMCPPLTWITLLLVFVQWTSWGYMVDTQLLCINKLGGKHWDKSSDLFLIVSKDSATHVYSYICRENTKYSQEKETYFEKESSYFLKSLFFPPRLLFKVSSWHSKCYFFKELIFGQCNEEFCVLT